MFGQHLLFCGISGGVSGTFLTGQSLWPSAKVSNLLLQYVRVKDYVSYVDKLQCHTEKNVRNLKSKEVTT